MMPTPGPDGDDGSGNGGWALMSQSGHLNSELPLCAPHKLMLGWDTALELPVVEGASQAVHLLDASVQQGRLRRAVIGDGNYNLSGTDVPYSEYLLFEARALVPAGLPAGMLAWHVDELVYLTQVFGHMYPTPPNTDEEYKFTDIIETGHDAATLVDHPVVPGDQATFARASDLWPFEEHDTILPEVPAGEPAYKYPSLLPHLSTAPYFDIEGPPCRVTSITRVEDGVTFNWSLGMPDEPPVIESFEPQLTVESDEDFYALWLSATITVSGTTDDYTVTLSYADAEGEPRELVWGAPGGVLTPVDLTPLFPNQRALVFATAASGAAVSEPAYRELDVVTLPGDINGDDEVNAQDLETLALALGLTSENPPFRPWFDTDGDGIVTEADASLIGYNFGTARPAP
jgi:hypothetical protein